MPDSSEMGAILVLHSIGVSERTAHWKAEIAKYRGPGETDSSLAGRGGIAPKVLYGWLRGKHQPRETTWESVTKRWRATRHLVDPDVPKAIQNHEAELADGVQRPLAEPRSSVQSGEPTSQEGAPMVDNPFGRAVIGLMSGFTAEQFEALHDAATVIAKRGRNHAPKEGLTR